MRIIILHKGLFSTNHVRLKIWPDSDHNFVRTLENQGSFYYLAETTNFRDIDDIGIEHNATVITCGFEMADDIKIIGNEVDVKLVNVTYRNNRSSIEEYKRNHLNLLLPTSDGYAIVMENKVARTNDKIVKSLGFIFEED
ncbi:14076_t:CDS:2 [Acaulospora colombiana]|uniref:14076_t:CDS:1 n=1 Tax=Acaulospora colombiana TaxID=27376 RepID=A0ACA9MRF3_9GLOM|nr:14076_t:CDS:2 [Acaulospora colombiana]